MEIFSLWVACLLLGVLAGAIAAISIASVLSAPLMLGKSLPI